MKPGQVSLYGLLGKHVDSVPTGCFKASARRILEPFENPVDTNSWRAEHIGKWLEAACNYGAYTHDNKLRAQIRDVVSRLGKAQQSDGWLGSYAPIIASTNTTGRGTWTRNTCRSMTGRFTTCGAIT